ncbi:MAG TPA: hypothetical protein VF158_10785 [Longimicrobiales bacterium]
MSTRVIPLAAYTPRPARWRLETPTARRERHARIRRILSGTAPARVIPMRPPVRWDAVESSYEKGPKDGGAA